LSRGRGTCLGRSETRWSEVFEGEVVVIRE
jgi:hypothetical protein